MSILDPVIDRRLISRVAATPGPFGALVPVTNRLVWPEQNLSDGSATSATYRSRHVIQEDTPYIVLAYVNAGTQTPQTYSVTYGAAVDSVPAGTSSLNSITPSIATFRGADTQTAAPGGVVLSDPIFGPWKRGASVLVRTYVSVATLGNKWPIGLTLNWGTWEGMLSGDRRASPNFSIAFTTNGPSATPMAILGPVQDRPCVAVVGDSIFDGAGDFGPGPYNNLGPASRALDGYCAHLKLAAPGERVASVVAAGGYMYRGAIAQAAKDVLSNYGTNDVGNADSLATIQANLLTFWGFFSGRRVHQVTIDPRTSSTDSWATAANQTPMAGESVRQALNTWLRAGAPIVSGTAVAVGTAGALTSGGPGHPLFAVHDTAARVEVDASNALTVNGGRWIVNGVANWPTADGIHNAAATSALKAAAINAGLILP